MCVEGLGADEVLRRAEAHGVVEVLVFVLLGHVDAVTPAAQPDRAEMGLERLIEQHDGQQAPRSAELLNDDVVEATELLTHSSADLARRTRNMGRTKWPAKGLREAIPYKPRLRHDDGDGRREPQWGRMMQVEFRMPFVKGEFVPVSLDHPDWQVDRSPRRRRTSRQPWPPLTDSKAPKWK